MTSVMNNEGEDEADELEEDDEPKLADVPGIVLICSNFVLMLLNKVLV